MIALYDILRVIYFPVFHEIFCFDFMSILNLLHLLQCQYNRLSEFSIRLYFNFIHKFSILFRLICGPTKLDIFCNSRLDLIKKDNSLLIKPRRIYRKRSCSSLYLDHIRQGERLNTHVKIKEPHICASYCQYINCNICKNQQKKCSVKIKLRKQKL